MKAHLQESRQPARSSAPPSGPRASGSCLTPCRPATFHTTLRPGSAPPSGPRSPRPHRLPTGIDQGGKRIGIVLWRVRSVSSRFAVGRSRPQQETFRRPTAILVDPATTSAALVLTDFVTKVLRQRRTSARCLRAAVAVDEPCSRAVQSGGSDVASSGGQSRPARLRERCAHGAG
jgi:hypothetical protein